MTDPYHAYQQYPTGPLYRVEVIERIYDRVLEQIDAGLAALDRGDEEGARPYFAHASVIIGALGVTIDASAGELQKNFVRLYEFVQYSLSTRRRENVEAAKKVMETLREAIEAIRHEAIAMERRGEIPPLQPSATIA